MSAIRAAGRKSGSATNKAANLKQISGCDSQKGQLAWAPDSKAILYTRAATRSSHKYDFATGKTTVLARGEVVGFGGSAALSNPRWSPDGKWISYTKAGTSSCRTSTSSRRHGGQERRLTEDDSYSDSNALWTPDGKQIIYLSGIDVANIGQTGRSTAQIYTVSLTPEEKDPRDKSIDSETQAKTERPRDRRRPFWHGSIGRKSQRAR